MFALGGGEAVGVEVSQVLAGPVHARPLALEAALVSGALVGLVEAPGAVDGPVAEVSVAARSLHVSAQYLSSPYRPARRRVESWDCGMIDGLPREAQRPWREGVLQMVSDLRCELISMRSLLDRFAMTH